MKRAELQEFCKILKFKDQISKDKKRADSLFLLGFVLLFLSLTSHKIFAAEESEFFHQELGIKKGLTVKIENMSGKIELRSTEGNKLRIEAQKTVRARSSQEAKEHLPKLKIGVIQDEQGVRIKTESPRTGFWVPFRRGISSWVDYSLFIPQDVNVEASSFSGDLLLEGLKGRVEASTLSGDVKARDIVGYLNLETKSGDLRIDSLSGEAKISVTSGDISCQKIKGNIRINGTSGDIKMVQIDGNLEIDLVSGDITVQNSDGDISINTTSGDVRVTASSFGNNRWEVETTSGDIKLRIPSSASCRIDIETVSGRIHSRIPLTVESISRRKLQGRLGNGAGSVRLSTSSGDVELLSLD